MPFRHYAHSPFVIITTLVLILLLSYVHISFAASGVGSAAAAGGIEGASSAISDVSSSANKVFLIVLSVIMGVIFGACIVSCIGKRSLLILQVGLTGEARPSLQRLIDLAAIPIATDTSAKGWHHHILIETTIALLRHSQYSVFAYSSVEKGWSILNVIRKLKQVSKQERQKFDIEESLANFNNVRSHRLVVPEAHDLDKDYIVVTILVATKGVYKSPPIMSTIDDIIEALKFLITIDISQILALEVLWTPQYEIDTLSRQELEARYPRLRAIDTP